VRSLPAVPISALLIYAGAMVAYIYGFEHRPDADYAREIGPDEVLVLASVAMLHLALGAVVGRLARRTCACVAGPARDSGGRLSGRLAGDSGRRGDRISDVTFRSAAGRPRCCPEVGTGSPQRTSRTALSPE
jgi:hypothetical protein